MTIERCALKPFVVRLAEPLSTRDAPLTRYNRRRGLMEVCVGERWQPAHEHGVAAVGVTRHTDVRMETTDDD